MSMVRRNKAQRAKKQNKNQIHRFGSAIPNQLYSNSFPREMKVTLNYAEYYTLVSSSTLFIDQVMNLNSIFDPDRSGTGHQPQGHDQWALFYNRYRVDRAHVTATLTNSPVGGARLAILGSNDATSITVGNTVIESPMGRFNTISTYGSSATVSKGFDLAILTGVARHVYEADDRYSSTFGSNPGEVLVCHIGCDSNAGTFTYYVTVKVAYMVTLFDPIQLTSS